ncbi:uncharacterized protein LOC126381130 [Pectinophora gossypiella]|uniref:uncharacterized protein LOC126381130 n=1 Tax=Pectinophora gossypiella TaxID=13191 RepID=UPI00214E3959|nr:uncharacterized protein LOC126381130 [Pectinophora gossypiella]
MANVIINEFLTFVQNKIDVLDELSIVQICATNFTEAEIFEGKNVLYTACGGGFKNVLRKGDDKKKKNVTDVMKLLKEIDPDAQPTFVAKDLNRLPPVTFDYVDVTRLLKDMTVIKSELTNFQLKMTDEMTDLRNSLDAHASKDRSESMMTITPKRLLTKQSLPPMNQSAAIPDGSHEAVHTPTYRDIVLDQSRSKRPRRAKPVRMLTDITGVNGVTKTTSARPSSGMGSAGASQISREIVTTQLPSNANDDSYTMVNRTKRKAKTSNMRGTLESSTHIEVAEPQCHVYVSRTKKTVTVEDMKEHIRERGQECMSIELLKAYNETSFNSFKVTVRSGQLDVFLDAGFWPAGLVYRRYRERYVRNDTKQTRNG